MLNKYPIKYPRYCWHAPQEDNQHLDGIFAAKDNWNCASACCLVSFGISQIVDYRADKYHDTGYCHYVNWYNRIIDCEIYTIARTDAKHYAQHIKYCNRDILKQEPIHKSNSFRHRV